MRTYIRMTRNKECGEKEKSNLALDVNSAEGGSLDGIEASDTFASQEIEIVSAFLEQVLCIVINNELARVFIGHKSKLLSNEAKFHIWLESGSEISKVSRRIYEEWYSRFAYRTQSSKTFTTDKHIHEIYTQNGRILV